jgi:hypothetical protein
LPGLIGTSLLIPPGQAIREVMVVSQASKSRLSRVIKNFQVAYKDKERKSLIKISKEFLLASLKTKGIATYYFTSFLYKKNITNYLDYLCHKEWQYLQRVICDSETFAIQGNKLFFQQYFENAKLPMPKLLAYNIREKMIVRNVDGWSSHEILSPDDLEKVIKELLAKSSNNSLFIKPAIGSGGKGAMRISDRSSELPNILIPSFFKYFLAGSFIFQDEVTQHKDLAVINPGTLNTIRIDTFKKPGGKPEILSALLRVGRTGSCVDNASAGGIIIGIDVESGTLKESGFCELRFGGFFYKQHPDTGIPFQGFRIPLFDDVRQFVIETASWLPQSLVGWDIAVSDQGPVLIEGNSVYYGMDIMDITYGGYRNNPVYQKVVDYVKSDLKKTN